MADKPKPGTPAHGGSQGRGRGGSGYGKKNNSGGGKKPATGGTNTVRPRKPSDG